MDLTLPIILSIAEIGGLLVIGGAARFLRYIDEPDIDRWSKLVLDFLFPALIFDSITRGFQTERLHELWPLPFIGLGLPVAWILIGILLQKGLRTRDGNIRRTFLYFCAINNNTFLPIVIVRNIWGDAMLANLFFLTLGSTVATWTVGVGALGSASLRSTLRNLCTPGLAATLLALAVVLVGWERHIPLICGNVLKSAGAVTVPMMIILAGASMFKPSVWRLSWPVTYAALVRLLVLPVCTIALLQILPLSRDVYQLSVIIAVMPLAVSSVIYTRIFGGSPDYAASGTLATTTAAIVTIPLTLWLLARYAAGF